MIFKHNVDIAYDLEVAGDITVNNGNITLGGLGRITGVDTVSAATDAANKAYVDATVSAATYTPTMYQVDTVAPATTNRTLVCNTTLIAAGSTVVTTAGANAGELLIEEAGVYEISYSVAIKVPTGVTTRQVVAMYIIAGGTPVAGSLNSTYLRLPGSNQGGATSLFNRSFVAVTANTSIALELEWLDGTTQSLDIYEPASIQNAITFRRIS